MTKNTEDEECVLSHLTFSQTARRMISEPFFSVGISLQLFSIISGMVQGSAVVQWLVKHWLELTRYLWGLIPFVFIPHEVRDFLTFTTILLVTAVAVSMSNRSQIRQVDHPAFEWLGLAVMAVVGLKLWGPAFKEMIASAEGNLPKIDNMPMWLRMWGMCVVVAPAMMLFNEQSDEWKQVSAQHMPFLKFIGFFMFVVSVPAWMVLVERDKALSEGLVMAAFLGFFLCIYIVISRRQLGILVPAALLAVVAVLIDQAVVFANNPPWSRS